MDKDIHAMFQQVFERLDEIKANMRAQLFSTAQSEKKRAVCPISLEEYVDIETICQTFKISKKTLRRYRTQGLIPFYKIKGKVYFLESEVREALKKHYYGG